MRRITRQLGVLVSAVLLALTATQAGALVTATPAAASNTAYFNLRDHTGSDFVVRLTDPQTIDEARDIVANELPKLVIGQIIKSPAPYNPQWSFHYDPTSITFNDMATEVCDATIPYVEEHLDEAGDAFLPDLNWCPWTGRLTAEITAR